MRHQSSRSLAGRWLRVPPATAQLLSEATKYGRPVRALVALLVVMALGAGSYAVGRVITDPPSNHRATSADPTPSQDGGQPEPTAETPSSGDPTQGGSSTEPGATATGRSKTSSPTTGATPTPQSK